MRSAMAARAAAAAARAAVAARRLAILDDDLDAAWQRDRAVTRSAIDRSAARPAAPRAAVETAGSTVREPELLEQHVQLLPVGRREAVQHLRQALSVLQRLPAARASHHLLETLIASPVVRPGKDRSLERILQVPIARSRWPPIRNSVGQRLDRQSLRLGDDGRLRLCGRLAF